MSSRSVCVSTRFGQRRAGVVGHPTSAMSAADLMAVLMARHLHYSYEDRRTPTTIT